MATKPNPINVDDAALDRLVDGELNEAERRRLLAGLDDVPNGWRQCALAFLESQCWKQSFGTMAERPAAPLLPALPSPPMRSMWPSHLRTLAAMAASFLIAFWIGSLFHATSQERAGLPGPSAGQVASTATTPQTPVHYASPEMSRDVRPTTKPWQVVTVSSPNTAAKGQKAMRLPAEERNAIDRQWLNNVPQAMPEDVRQAFARNGHQVEQRRELVPVPLEDGRRLVVPVDQVDVHYVNQKY